MSIVLGYHRVTERDVEIVQEESRVALRAPVAAGKARSIIDRRNGIIGNGPTSGDGVFDFRYGPFTGGYPEAGILHYYTYGERILSVEVDLSLKHRGIETSLQGRSVADGLRGAAEICGTLSAAHAVAYLRAIESVSNIEASEEAQRMRIVMIELERIYNHLYVIMRLASAAAQKVLAAHLAALFENALRIVHTIAGERSFRGLFSGVQPVARPDAADVDALVQRVERIRSDFMKLFERSLASRNYLDRLHRTAIVDPETAIADSLTGPSLRACGFAWDLRAADPLTSDNAVRVRQEADAFARMEVRAEEIGDSCAIISHQLGTLGHSDAERAMRSREFCTVPPVAADDAPHSGTGIGAVESASGTVAWLLEIEAGRVTSAHVSSPSVFGFQTYADAIVGNIFTDVPFAIESFGVSFADAGR